MQKLGRATVHRLLAVGFVIAAAVAGPVWAQDGTGPVVSTAGGDVRGVTENGVNIFRGIPYAAPPVGDLRWMPPQAAAGWEGELEATAFKDYCAQPVANDPFAGPASINEDCLYLNVFTTEGDASAKKPVIVWVHGGANVVGGARDYDGSKLATGGPNGVETVVVTINYRLGLFGFLSQSQLNAEGHPFGNYGLMDVQAALQWVQDNIEAFGGDPDNVTVGGQSAGSINATANLLSPGSKDLAHKLIAQSIPIGGFYFAPTDVATAAGDKFAAAASCTTSACLRGLSAARILQLQSTPGANGPFIIGPSVDGTVIPMAADAAYESGSYNMMPILGGSTHDEWGSVIGGEILDKQVPAGITAEEYAERNPEPVLELYPLSDFGDNPTLAQMTVTTDWFVCMGYRTLTLQASTNTFPMWGYEFTYKYAPYYLPQMPNENDPKGVFRPLAYHTADIQFVFPKWHGGALGVNLDQITGKPRELEAKEIDLSDQIVAAWTNFAATGNPNGTGESPWPQFTKDNPVLLVQTLPDNTTKTGEEFNTEHKCDFWFPPSE